ncbi:MAG: helix-turn-helix transcriptional regulator [Bacillota bacterium]
MVLDHGRLRTARVSKGFSLRRLAAMVGLSPSYLSEVESGKKEPSPEVLLRLSFALGLKADQMIQSSPGEILALLLECKKINMAELANKTGIPEDTLRSAASGSGTLDPASFHTLASALDVDPCIFTGVHSLLGSRIRQLREQQHFTQSELAKKAELSTALISAVENGRVRPSLASLRRISEALGVSPCEFLRIATPVAPATGGLLERLLHEIGTLDEDQLRFVYDMVLLLKKHRANRE